MGARCMMKVRATGARIGAILAAGAPCRCANAPSGNNATTTIGSRPRIPLPCLSILRNKQASAPSPWPPRRVRNAGYPRVDTRVETGSCLVGGPREAPDRISIAAPAGRCILGEAATNSTQGAGDPRRCQRLRAGMAGHGAAPSRGGRRDVEGKLRLARHAHHAAQ